MLHRTPRTPRAPAFLALAVLTACGGSGGGGGGGGPPVVVIGDATFQGDYFTILKAGGHGVTAQARGATGILLADGAGTAVHSQTSNDSGTVSGPDTSLYSFDVAADGMLEVSVPSGVFARGGIAADGECALLGSVTSGAFPGIIVLRRRQGLYADASLSGDYHLVYFAFSPLSLASVAATGTATFDGSGGASGAITSNNMGVLTSGTLGPTSYSVIADGTSTLSVIGADIEGGVVSGGAVALWGGSTSAGQAPAIFIAVKEAPSGGLNTLQGAYWIVVLERDPGSDDFRSLHGTATADGVGGLTLVGTSNTEGVLAAEPPGSTTYTVTSTGRLTIDAGGSVLAGGVSADGRFAVAAGGTAPGSDPTIVVLCRK